MLCHSLSASTALQNKEVEGIQIKQKGAKGDADKIGKEKAVAEDKLNKISAELQGTASCLSMHKSQNPADSLLQINDINS